MMKINTTNKKFNIKHSIILIYFVIGIILVAATKFFLKLPLAFSDYIIASTIGGLCVFIAHFYIGNKIYDDWWEIKFPISRISCSCPDCESWRTKKSKKLYLSIPLLIIYFLVLSFFVFLSPYLPLDYGVGKRISEQEVKIKVSNLLELSLRSKVITFENFKIKTIPTDEIVKGKKGEYYEIDLEYSKFGQKVLFEAGKYTINPINNKFIVCMNSFVDSVFVYMRAGFEAEILVKGSADILSQNDFSDNLDSNFGVEQGFSRFTYLPIADNNKWKFENALHVIKKQYTNTDLPNLRGRYIQFTFEKAYQYLPIPKILEGKVEEKVNADLRNANIILYIDPSKKKN